ncbi:hypothetical protein Y032_0345g3115 [Ancylostoma ceylanicum]|nr:hypothetical protein Y032_0345g3115 [Ancylostoma ceylanicum]
MVAIFVFSVLENPNLSRKPRFAPAVNFIVSGAVAPRASRGLGEAMFLDSHCHTNKLSLLYKQKWRTQKASASLNELEFREYAELLHRSKHGELPLRELAHKLMELFGPRRKHLLTRLHLLIRDEDQAEFREFLELHNITDSDSVV